MESQTMQGYIADRNDEDGADNTGQNKADLLHKSDEIIILNSVINYASIERNSHVTSSNQTDHSIETNA